MKNFCLSLLRLCRDNIAKKNRSIRNNILRKRIKNKNFTLICDNCTGGVLYHDLGLPFLSPTINLYIVPDDYLKFISNLEYYTSAPLVESTEKGIDADGREYPIGIIEDVKVYFMHYSSFDEAKEKWELRCKRINWDNLFFVMHKRSEKCQERHIASFDVLPIKNKVIFINNPRPDIISSYYIKGFEKENGVGNIMWYKSPKILAKRYYEDFDFIGWINGEKPRP